MLKNVMRYQAVGCDNSRCHTEEKGVMRDGIMIRPENWITLVVNNRIIDLCPQCRFLVEEFLKAIGETERIRQ